MQQQNFTEPKHGCGFWPSMEGTGGEEKALSEGPKASESGWTMYLDQSIHECSGYTKSLIEFEEEEARNGKNGKVWFHQKDEEDSSSMASDASSGPAQPLEAVTPKEFYNKVGCDGLKLSDLDVADLRKPKRRRLESDEQKDLDLLEDTASSPVCSFKSGLTENEAQIKYFLDFSKVLCDSHEQADAVNKRLDLLQSILPETPICREETLGAAIKYISSLEQRIKTFEGKDKSKDSHVVQAARENMEGESGILRERGLCLVPISSLCNAI